VNVGEEEYAHRYLSAIKNRAPICLILADVGELESHICKRRADVGRLLPPFNLKSPNLKS
jgi:hypothetical protein